jgi:serine/threonine-protein phosphatase 6 catalytic subunit
LQKYGSSNVWRWCNDIFDHLPIGAVIGARLFCVHGGISPEYRTIDQIRTIQRNQEIPQEGGYCDLMWSDPEEHVEDGRWMMSPRGAGWLFGEAVTKEVRSHSLCFVP